MSRLAGLAPHQFADRLRAEGIRRGYLVHEPDTRAYAASHPLFEDLVACVHAESGDGDPHEAIFFGLGPESGALFGVFVHATRRGQAQGGLRRVPFGSMRALLRDGLRLSLAMTRKSALADLWWGGGKALIAAAPGELDASARRTLYREFGAFTSSLRGCYVTGEDAGTTPLDMAEVARTTRFATCTPEALGGSGNPSDMTAAGVVCAMEAALEFEGLGGLAGRRVALQGTGQVGSALLRRLFERGVASIAAAEADPDRRTALLDAFEDRPLELRAAEPGDDSILAEPCDVLAPCALGGVLGPKTIPTVQARVVCGAANNPLADERRDAEALRARGITYVPDFVANRMGIVSCANEQYGHVNADPRVLRHFRPDWPGGIHAVTRRVLELARAADITPLAAARRLADACAEQVHPIWGHRGRRIVESLVADRWEQG